MSSDVPEVVQMSTQPNLEVGGRRDAQNRQRQDDLLRGRPVSQPLEHGIAFWVQRQRRNDSLGHS